MFRSPGRRKKKSALFQPSAMSSRRAPRKRRRVSIILGAGIAVLIVIFIATVRSRAEGVFWQFTAPLYAVESAVSSRMNVFIAPFESKVALVNKNAALQTHISALTAEVADRSLLAAENANLEAELGDTPSTPQKSILANVIARPPQLPYDELVANVGESKGAAAGNLVGVGNTVIGIVKSVSPSTSQVRLFSASGVSTNALLNGSTPVLLAGQGGGEFQAQVPQDTPIYIGDAVSLPGLPDYAIAVIEHIDSENGSAFKELYLSLPVDLFLLSNVEILPGTSLPAAPQAASSSAPA